MSSLLYRLSYSLLYIHMRIKDLNLYFLIMSQVCYPLHQSALLYSPVQVSHLLLPITKRLHYFYANQAWLYISLHVKFFNSNNLFIDFNIVISTHVTYICSNNAYTQALSMN